MFWYINVSVCNRKSVYFQYWKYIIFFNQKHSKKVRIEIICYKQTWQYACSLSNNRPYALFAALSSRFFRALNSYGSFYRSFSYALVVFLPCTSLQSFLPASHIYQKAQGLPWTWILLPWTGYLSFAGLYSAALPASGDVFFSYYPHIMQSIM